MSSPIPCDVLVAGGGAAGIAASIAGAREGASVVLLERSGCFGGMATGALVGTICGLYLRGEGDGLGAPVNTGFPIEFTASLMHATCTSPIIVPPGLGIVPFDANAFALHADREIAAHPSIKPVLHATMCGIESSNGRIARVDAFAWDRMQSFAPKSVVDCTGEASVARAAGAEMIDHGTAIASSAVFVIAGVASATRESAGRLALLRQLARGANDGSLPVQAAFASIVPSSDDATSIAIKIVVPTGVSDSAPERVARLEREARAVPHLLTEFIRVKVPGCERAHLARVAPQVGIRLGSTAVGDETLREADVLECRARPDGIARAAWPIEEWSESGRPSLEYLPPGAAYEIPAGALRVRGFQNLFVAGRCISAEPRALASARVIGTCLATGWAAGVMAAQAATGASPDACIARIRADLGMNTSAAR